MALFSPHWHRVATLRPRLVPQLRVRRQRWRGDTWYLLADGASGRSCRLNAQAYALAGRLDGQHTVQHLWERLQALTDAPPTQDDTVDLLARLREQGLVQFDRSADFGRWLPHLAQSRRQTTRFNPLAWRRPLADPSRLLERLTPLAHVLFNRPVATLWALGLLATLVGAASHAAELGAYAERALAQPHMALWALGLWLPLKLVHELAHGLALRRFGGTVHEAGVTLMLGLPVPYVDASAANTLVRRRERLTVGAAGMAAELALAGPALACWVLAADGPLREAAFALLGVAGVSTLLFNANPLQRLDGYHLLTDALGLPNLATRSRAWWLNLLQRRLLALPGAEALPLARGERGWLLAYAPLSWVWLLGVAATGVGWLAGHSAAAGLLAATVLGVQVLGLPAWRLGQQLRRSATAQRGARRRLAGALAASAGALLLLAALPLPHSLVAQGVVWPNEQAQLRPQSSGFVHQLWRQDGDRVAAGEPVLSLHDPVLEAERQRQQARLAALESAWHAALPDDAGRSAELQASLQALRAQIERLQQRSDGLVLHARVAGTLALPQAADLQGRHVAQGSLLGQVLTAEPPTVRVALPEDQAQRLRQTLQAVAVWRADAPPWSPWPGRHGAGPAAHPGQAPAPDTAAPQAAQQASLQAPQQPLPQPARPLPAMLLAQGSDGAAAVQRLPSAALARRHGGPIDTDPQDPEALRTLQPVLLLDVQLLPQAGAPVTDAARLGSRVWVRFDLGHAPLALQLLQAWRRHWQHVAHPQA